ncbi:hypothetical protein MYP_1469 [Sporocytophaga myxococcoides]|uniref:Uncharacterized protein n=1 Tax=Sporocytophaga myxococcoides TaxID=153721 RepID=A0A098LBH6_9BACT|nr:hypothetical protein [Sporocytophaga myxococcoides]GAL84241.1 hypothetical protein MYP_1469 [Sporocytophaga myxococcoides]
MSFINPILPIGDIKSINQPSMSSSNGNIPVSEYHDCIKKVQEAFPSPKYHSSLPHVLSSLRRLYYGGTLFGHLLPLSRAITIPVLIWERPKPEDLLPDWNDKNTLSKLKQRASENGINDNPSPYLELTLNGRQELIDVGHLLLTFDALLHPTTTIPYSSYDVPNIDPASWIADVAIAVYWHDIFLNKGKYALKEAEFTTIGGDDKNALINKILSKSQFSPDDFFSWSAPDSDLLGDIDGFVMKHLSSMHPTETLSEIFNRYYIQPPKDTFARKRYWFFCFLNELNYNYATQDWEDINYIRSKYNPRIDRCVDLFYSGFWSLPGSVSPPSKKSYKDTSMFLQLFLDWLKPRLQEELRTVHGKSLPKSGKMF